MAERKKYETPQDFTPALAAMDALPVLCFGAGMVLAARTLGSVLFALGAAVITLAGCGKVLWKLLLMVILQWCTSPLSGHMLAQFEYRVNQNLEQHLELPDGEQEAGQ